MAETWFERKMMGRKIQRVFYTGLALFIGGCAESGRSGEIQNDEFSLRPPLQMRALVQDELRAQITLNNATSTYQGTEFPDGVWRIPFDLEANRTYALGIEWSHGNYPLMDENGFFSTTDDTFVIRPDLDFINAGYRRFDNDCDGVSNLEELVAGSDPDGPLGTRICPGEPDPNVAFGTFEQAYLGKRYEAFGQITNGRAIDKIEQSVQVRRSENGQRYSLGGVLTTSNDPDDLGIVANILLVNDPELGRSASFIMDQIVGFSDGDVPGARCEPRTNLGALVWRCTIPYVWEEGSWYSLVIERTGDRSWEGSVLDQNTGSRVSIGTLTTDLDIIWTVAQIGIGYSGRFGRDECQSGLAPLGLQFTHALVNNVIEAETRESIVEPCLGISGHWNHSQRSQPAGQLHTLYLGIPEG